jgi:hypothetical protein
MQQANPIKPYELATKAFANFENDSLYIQSLPDKELRVIMIALPDAIKMTEDESLQ